MRQIIRIMALIFCLSGAIPAETITPYANNVTLYKNIDDRGDARGTTFQVVSINGLNLGTSLIVELTADFNWNYDFVEKHDYYMELSLVKPVYKSLSVNYQRIYGTFVSEPINQFGIRLSLFQ